MKGKVQSFVEFRNTWQASHPHDTVKKEVVGGVSLWVIIGVALSLIAVNILSASHSIPVIVDTVQTTNTELKIVVAIAAFIGIELTMFVFMVFSSGGLLKWFVIFMALAVATIANITSTVHALEASKYALGGAFVGLVLGIFAPFANLAIGEHFRKILEKNRSDHRTADATYNKALKDLDTRIRAAYTRYLNKSGITDESTINRYILGEVENESANADRDNDGIGSITLVPSSKPSVKRSKNGGKRGNSVSTNRYTPETLATELKAQGRENWSYNKIASEYGVSPNTVSKAKRLIA